MHRGPCVTAARHRVQRSDPERRRGVVKKRRAAGRTDGPTSRVPRPASRRASAELQEDAAAALSACWVVVVVWVVLVVVVVVWVVVEEEEEVVLVEEEEVGRRCGEAAMFVQEEKIFAGRVLKVLVCTAEGAEWLEEVTEDTTVETLKERCLKHCVHGSLEDPKTLTHHTLIHAATERILTDTKTVTDENIKDRGTRPRPPPQSCHKKQENKAPDKDAILKATAGLSTKHTDRTVTQHNIRDVSSSDFQTELRKILVSLIEVAQKLLALNPDAVELFKKANASPLLDEDDEDRVDETAHAAAGPRMGLPESRARQSSAPEPPCFLVLGSMSVTQAMEWLIEHVDDPSVDTPLPGQEAAAAASGAVGATATATAAASATPGPAVPALAPVPAPASGPLPPRGVRQASVVMALMEMGFDEKEVVDALRVNNNQQDAACEWLLGDRKPSPEDLDKGMDTGSPLFQAILENPVVQLGLTNPKTLLAFEDMLENPLNSTQWMNDPETGPVMLQISRIFQTLNRT
ncbi:hypothetical protein CRUP_000997 [Coryphaenoides rupestris]|nr:hypothetical protein CRUP_000997 [Coryphaenoides rupestris]